MIVECISVGTEILLGDILNTNVQYLSQLCASLGFDLFHTSVVGDNRVRLLEELEQASRRADIIILTGGLGSTDDDITKRCVIEFLGTETETNAFNKDVVDRWFHTEKARIDNTIVYTFPIGSTILENHVGTASGAWIPFNQNGKQRFIVILPGPPGEMRPMADRYLRPILEQHSTSAISSLEVKVGVIGEYQLNELLKEEIQNGINPTFAPYVRPDGALLRITAKAENDQRSQQMIQDALQHLKAKIGEYIVAVGDESRSEALIRMLSERQETISTAESITGGMLASAIVDAPGASRVFSQSFVTYSDETKHRLLGVPQECIEAHTAVSREVCASMVQKLHDKTQADLCLSTTGYAGPEGENVGLAYVGVLYHGNVAVYPLHLQGSRMMIRRIVRNQALDRAILMLKQKEEAWAK